MDNYVLLMPFLDESESFANGFAMGQLWEKMSNSEVIDKTLYNANRSQIVYMCDHFGYEYEVVDNGEYNFDLKAHPINISGL